MLVHQVIICGSCQARGLPEITFFAVQKNEPVHRAHKFGPHGFSHGHPWGHGPACCGGHPGEDAHPDDAEAPTEEQVVKVQPEPDAD